MIALTKGSGFEKQDSNLNRPRRNQWVGLLPLVVLPLVVVSTGRALPAWGFMWAISFSIFVSLKWLTWWKARFKVDHTALRSAAYLLMWPGMDGDSFLNAKSFAERPTARQWVAACSKTGLGAICLWFLARRVPLNMPLLRGWIGMLGLILSLHFGIFHILALAWQRIGVAAEPIMRAPLRSQSLSDFWGKRWNLGFSQLSHSLIFLPLYRQLGAGFAGFLVFLVSGLLHDVVISVPARGGYGLPTLYFAIQAGGVAFERSAAGKQLGLGRAPCGWFFMAVVTAGPAFWLFHPPFVRNVMLPFMKAIEAL